jgi:vacuolar-type H+-ATPase subunit C/Vma6
MPPPDAVNLAARVHARRSRIHEGAQLDRLCGLSAIPDLADAVLSGVPVADAVDFQRRLVQHLADEIAGCLRFLDGPAAEWVAWQLARFQVENLKTILRGHMARSPMANQRRHLVDLPEHLALDTEGLISAASLPEFLRRIPGGIACEALAAALAVYGDRGDPLFYEASLDRAYFLEAIRRTDRLPDDDRDAIRPLTAQETDAFHLQVVARGRFQRGLDADRLLPLHVQGSLVSFQRFSDMLHAADLSAVAVLAVGRAIDAFPPADADASTLDAMAGNRCLRLARRALRRGHMALGALAGYVALRRVEAANLITISEGIRIGVSGDPIRARMAPRALPGSAHV